MPPPVTRDEGRRIAVTITADLRGWPGVQAQPLNRRGAAPDHETGVARRQPGGPARPPLYLSAS